MNLCKQEVVERMHDEHLQASRGWALVRNKLQLTPDEKQHLEECEQCHAWLSGFTEMARRSGFEITYFIPNRKPRNGTDG